MTTTWSYSTPVLTPSPFGQLFIFSLNLRVLSGNSQLVYADFLTRQTLCGHSLPLQVIYGGFLVNDEKTLTFHLHSKYVLAFSE